MSTIKTQTYNNKNDLSDDCDNMRTIDTIAQTLPTPITSIFFNKHMLYDLSGAKETEHNSKEFSRDRKIEK